MLVAICVCILCLCFDVYCELFAHGPCQNVQGTDLQAMPRREGRGRQLEEIASAVLFYFVRNLHRAPRAALAQQTVQVTHIIKQYWRDIGDLKAADSCCFCFQQPNLISDRANIDRYEVQTHTETTEFSPVITCAEGIGKSRTS